jgi:uncharacterized membrane protein
VTPDAAEDRAQSALRLFTIGYLVVGAIGIASSSAEFDEESLTKTRLIVLVAALIPFFILLIAGTTGLLMLRKWGAWLHLASTVVSAAMGPVLGAITIGPLDQILSGVSYLFAGAIYGIAFFSTALARKPPV